jgi:hypothetical protein
MINTRVLYILSKSLSAKVVKPLSA